MKDKEKIIATLKKLKEMAEKGCNEQEVETAARMLQKQMEKYGISFDDLRDEKKAGKQCKREDFFTRIKNGGDMNIVLVGIADLFDCKLWSYSKQHYQFFGLPGDTQAATAISLLIEAACSKELREYTKSLCKVMYERNSSQYHAARKDFRRGFLYRVYVRLVEIKREQKAVAAKNALVVRKQDIIEAEMKERGIATRKKKGRSTTMYSNTHFNNGQARGNETCLNVGGQIAAS